MVRSSAAECDVEASAAAREDGLGDGAVCRASATQRDVEAGRGPHNALVRARVRVRVKVWVRVRVRVRIVGLGLWGEGKG